MADNILLGWTKEPVIQSILAARSEENEPSFIISFYGEYCMQFFVDMETVTFSYALLIGDALSSTLCNSLNMGNDALAQSAIAIGRTT